VQFVCAAIARREVQRHSENKFSTADQRGSSRIRRTRKNKEEEKKENGFRADPRSSA
jgi:hypothetical protein